MYATHMNGSDLPKKLFSQHLPLVSPGNRRGGPESSDRDVQRTHTIYTVSARTDLITVLKAK